jgi:hypothetical protein
LLTSSPSNLARKYNSKAEWIAPPKIRLDGMKSAGAFSTYKNANFRGQDRIVESWEWDRYVRPVICSARRLGGFSGTVRAGESGAVMMLIAKTPFF